MDKIEENKQKKRSDILSAAQKAFLSDGYVLANMDKIAAQAQVTKQTVYRYYGSKIELFRVALEQMRDSAKRNYFDHLDNPDTERALYEFAREFIRWHVSDEHLAIYRLLVAEGIRAPEVAKAFFTVGPEKTNLKLSQFFEERLEVSCPEITAKIWIATLLAPRNATLIGQPTQTDEKIDKYAKEVTHFLLAATSRQ